MNSIVGLKLPPRPLFQSNFQLTQIDIAMTADDSRGQRERAGFQFRLVYRRERPARHGRHQFGVNGRWRSCGYSGEFVLRPRYHDGIHRPLRRSNLLADGLAVQGRLSCVLERQHRGRDGSRRFRGGCRLVPLGPNRTVVLERGRRRTDAGVRYLGKPGSGTFHTSLDGHGTS